MPGKVSELSALWQKQTDDFSTLARLTLAEQPRGRGKARAKKAKQ
jgi:hypothetical protein